VISWATDNSTNVSGNGTIEVVQSVVTISGNVATAGPQTLVNTVTATNQSPPTLVALPDGGYVTIWSDNATGNGGGPLRGQLFSSVGTKVGADFVITSTWVTESATIDADSPVLSAKVLSNGNVVVSWAVDDGVSAPGVGNIAGNNTSEIAQSLLQISSSGVSVGAPTMVNTWATLCSLPWASRKEHLMRVLHYNLPVHKSTTMPDERWRVYLKLRGVNIRRHACAK
jgi:hypothetical protein